MLALLLQFLFPPMSFLLLSSYLSIPHPSSIVLSIIPNNTTQHAVHQVSLVPCHVYWDVSLNAPFTALTFWCSHHHTSSGTLITWLCHSSHGTWLCHSSHGYVIDNWYSNTTICNTTNCGTAIQQTAIQQTVSSLALLFFLASFPLWSHLSPLIHHHSPLLNVVVLSFYF